MIIIEVSLWGQLKNALQKNSVRLELSEPYTVQNAFCQLARCQPEVRELLLTSDGQCNPSILIFVNGRQQAVDKPLDEGDQLSLMSPIAGG